MSALELASAATDALITLGLLAVGFVLVLAIAVCLPGILRDKDGER